MTIGSVLQSERRETQNAEFGASGYHLINYELKYFNNEQFLIAIIPSLSILLFLRQ